jgi:hypothetical protein
VTTTLGNSTCSANISPSERGSILWFDPRREHSSIPTAKSRSRRAQGLSRLAASSRPPEGLGLDWPEHGGTLKRIGLEAALNLRKDGARWSLSPPQAGQSAAAHMHQECHHGTRQVIRNFNPLVLGQIHAASNTRIELVDRQRFRARKNVDAAEIG